MSWKALDWATDSAVGSSTTKFILLLLANKADENFSCYPSIRTLTAESDAGRSTVMRALNELEASGFITREPQFHDSGAGDPAAAHRCGHTRSAGMYPNSIQEEVKELENNVFDQLPLLLAVPRAAAILGISRAAAYRLAASGELPVRRLGGRVYVVTAELRELVAS